MEAVVVRSLLTAYDIPVLISGEYNGRWFGSSWGAFLPSVGPFQIKVFVSAAHAEDAAALLAGMRGSEYVLSGNSDLDRAAGDNGLDVAMINGPYSAATGLIAGRTYRWKETALALLLATMLGFGAAHLYYLRPWGRGAVLAIAQMAVLVFFAGSLHRLAVLLCIARIADVLGVLRQIWSGAKAKVCDKEFSPRLLEDKHMIKL